MIYGLDPMSFRYFVLGLLSQQPMSGYDIKCFLAHFDWLIGKSSYGNIYPTLHTLLEDGLVTVDVIDAQDKPSKKVYSVTQAGQSMFQDYMARIPVSNTSLKAFVKRLMLARGLSRDGLIAQLQRRRDQLAQECTNLEQMKGQVQESTGLGRLLSFEYGAKMAAAELAWLEDSLDRFSRQPEVVEGAE